MIIYVDGDACPKVIMEILFRAANRRKVKTLFVANHFLNLPKSPYIAFMKVGGGFDVADNHIVSLIEKNDLVITADIPLADGAIEKGGFALNPRGEFYTKENIKPILSLRNFMQEQRSLGSVSGGPPSFAKENQKAFADSLDRFLTKHLKT